MWWLNSSISIYHAKLLRTIFGQAQKIFSTSKYQNKQIKENSFLCSIETHVKIEVKLIRQTFTKLKFPCQVHIPVNHRSVYLEVSVCFKADFEDTNNQEFWQSLTLIHDQSVQVLTSVQVTSVFSARFSVLFKRTVGISQKKFKVISFVRIN